MEERHYPVIEFQLMRYDEEIGLLSSYLYNALKNQSLINIELFNKYKKLLNRFNSETTYLEIINFCSENLIKEYKENLIGCNEAITLFKEQINEQFYYLYLKIADEFEVSDEKLKIIVKVGNVSLCPRWINNVAFYVPSYIENFREILLHECCHFIFFKKLIEINSEYLWKDFEYPTTEWILSEILIDTIFADKKIFESYTNSKIRAYREFYGIDFDGKTLIENVNRLYHQENCFHSRFLSCYNFISKNRSEIVNRI